MNMLIAIPSRGRAGLLSKSTLRYIPPELLSRTILFVHVDEEAKYKRALFNCQFEQVQLVPLVYSKIGIKRWMMAQWAQSHGYKTICMVDDDISQFSVRVEPGKTSLRKASHVDCLEMFQTVELYLGWYAHVGVSQRFHNDAFVGNDPVVVENSRMIRFLAYRIPEYLACEHGHSPEDLDITLQLLQKGCKNAVLHKWCQDQTSSGMIGGASIYRTAEVHSDNIRKLHDRYPDFTRLREKSNISKEAIKTGFAVRTEIVIDWKKAYNEHEAVIRNISL